MKQSDIARRTFLKQLGLTGMTLPLVSSSLFAENEDEEPIKRIVLIEHPDGINPDHWFPIGTERDFTLPRMTEPFDLVKEDCVFLEGINLGGRLSGHGSYEGLWRGDTTGTSIDQYFAEKWRGKTDVTFLNTKVSSGYGLDKTLAYDTFGIGATALGNPLNIMDLIYTNSEIEANVYSSLEASKRRLLAVSSDLEKLKQGDMVNNELLIAHKKALDDLLDVLNAQTEETTSLNMDQWQNEFEAKATALGLTSRSESIWNNRILDENTAFETLADLHEDAIVTALKYDRTRVVNYSYGRDVWGFYVPCEDGNAYSYHTSGHEMGEGHIQTRRVTSRRVANLIQRLKDTNDIYGQPLLDSTLVVYACEIGHASNHTNKNAPFILAGAGLEGGRYLNYNGVLWNKVLVSIANILGDDLTSYGTADPEGGALDGLA